jgi:hypothetical protein
MIDLVLLVLLYVITDNIISCITLSHLAGSIHFMKLSFK